MRGGGRGYHEPVSRAVGRRWQVEGRHVEFDCATIGDSDEPRAAGVGWVGRREARRLDLSGATSQLTSTCCNRWNAVNDYILHTGRCMAAITLTGDEVAEEAFACDADIRRELKRHHTAGGGYYLVRRYPTADVL